MTVGVDLTKKLNLEHIIEENIHFSREVVAIAANDEKIIPGTVLAQDSTDQKFYPLDPAGANGRNVAKAILAFGVSASAADTKQIVHDKGNVVVNGHKIEWPEAITEAQQEAATAELRAVGILIRY